MRTHGPSIFYTRVEKTTPQLSTIISKKDKIIIRILWGNLTDQIKDGVLPKQLNEVKECCQSPNLLNEKSLSIAIGQNNYDFLKECGAKNLLLFDKNNLIQPEGYNHFWHKPYVIKQMLNEYKEVCFLDWDCILLKPIFNEEELWSTIHSKTEGVFKGQFQSTIRKYHRNYATKYREKDLKWNENNLDWTWTMNACLIYCRTTNIMNNYLKVFETIRDKIDTEDQTEETAFNLFYDQVCPYSPKEKMFEDFCSYVVDHGRRRGQLFRERLKNAIFSHK